MYRKLFESTDLTIWEQPPTVRSISVQHYTAGPITYHCHHLRWPYLVYVRTVRGGSLPVKIFSLYGSARPVRSPDDPVFVLPLPNCGHLGTVCLGPGSEDLAMPQMVWRFWESWFVSSPYTSRWNDATDWHSGGDPVQLFGKQTRPLRLFLTDVTPKEVLNLPAVFSETFTDTAIGRRAAELWESAGRPPGQDQAFWLRAEQDLLTEQYYPGRRR